MPAELAFLIVAVAVIAITYKTYVGYGDYRWYTKLGFFLFLLIGWSAPFLGFILRRADLPESFVYLHKFCFYALYFFYFFITYYLSNIERCREKVAWKMI